MKKVIISAMAMLLLISCEIQQANGPKVSKESLEEEMVTLAMFGTVEPMRALANILADDNLEKKDIGKFYQVSSSQWNFTATWSEGGSGRMWHCEASSPIRFDKSDDGSWLINYEGDGMEYYYYEQMYFKTTAIPVAEGWHIVTIGTIMDKDGYAMSFGTAGITLSTKNTYNGHWIDWEYSLSNGSFYMNITKDGEVVDSITLACSGYWNTTPLDTDYLHFSTARFYQTLD